MNPALIAVGGFFTLEGAANIYYWRNDNHPWYFQVGRGLRIVFGMGLVGAGVAM
jgi:hypothetical protein